jgi:hypothetical protein
VADTKDKRQLNVLMTHAAHDLLDQLHSDELREAEAVGEVLPLGSYVERLIRAEAKRKGIKPTTKGRKA